MAGFGLSDPRTLSLSLAAEASKSGVDLTIDNYSSAGATIQDRTVARSRLRQMSKHPDRWLRVWAKMQPADGVMFREQPHIAAMVLAEMTEAVRAGPAGIVHEASLYHRD